MDKHAFMHACREGGAAIATALRALDRAYFALLHRECLRDVRDADVSHDLVQETFIKVWQRCATYQGDSELLPWIRVILRRNVLDRLRESGREVPMDTEMLIAAADERAIATEALVADAPLDAARERELAACFERCWERFREECPAHATVLAWIAEDGLANEQIAELLDRTPGATREFISQARKRARHYLAEWRALAFGGVAP